MMTSQDVCEIDIYLAESQQNKSEIVAAELADSSPHSSIGCFVVEDGYVLFRLAIHNVPLMRDEIFFMSESGISDQ